MLMTTKDTTLRIGSISTGTLRTEDLLPEFLWSAEHLRLTRAERITVRQIRARLRAADHQDDNAIASDEDYWNGDAAAGVGRSPRGGR